MKCLSYVDGINKVDTPGERVSVVVFERYQRADVSKRLPRLGRNHLNAVPKCLTSTHSFSDPDPRVALPTIELESWMFKSVVVFLDMRVWLPGKKSYK